MDAASLLLLLGTCAPLVDAATATAIIAVESGFNPHAIGVVDGHLIRQPRHRSEAVATARALQAGRWNYSAGLGQINVRNFDRLGLDLESAFDPCMNLQAMQTVLTECFARTPTPRHSIPSRASAQHRLRQALSCYYSGNFSTGLGDGYVQRVAKAAPQSKPLEETP